MFLTVTLLAQAFRFGLALEKIGARRSSQEVTRVDLDSVVTLSASPVVTLHANRCNIVCKPSCNIVAACNAGAPPRRDASQQFTGLWSFSSRKVQDASR